MVAKCPNLSTIIYRHIELVMSVHPELQWCCTFQQLCFIYLRSPSIIFCVSLQ